MAYEVVKTVKGRRYRYRVESYRDEAGKARGRWTYLGLADPGPAEPAEGEATAGRAAQTRRRLLAALGTLLEREEYARVTVAAIAKEAGLGHGTFYLHFRDVREALRAGIQSVRDNASTIFDTGAPLGTLAEERAKIAAWLEVLLGSSLGNIGVMRAYSALVAQDDEVAAEHARKRKSWLLDFAGYLRALHDAGLARVGDAEALAQMVSGLLEGVFRLAILERTPIGEGLRAYVTRAVDRAIFED